MKRISIDWENNADTWWDGARQTARRDAGSVVAATYRALASMQLDELTLDEPDARAFLDWCAAIPGWHDGPKHAPHPLLVRDV